MAKLRLGPDTHLTMDSSHLTPIEADSQESEALTKALAVFELNPPFSLETLKQRHEKLLLTWHPPRYANLTNNPTKYMQMYKKGEAKTKEIEAAFRVLMNWLTRQNLQSPD